MKEEIEGLSDSSEIKAASKTFNRIAHRA